MDRAPLPSLQLIQSTANQVLKSRADEARNARAFLAMSNPDRPGDDKMDSLIARIRARIAAGCPCDFPNEWLPVQRPIARKLIADAEVQLGFSLPDLLQQLYAEVGNGGYGPCAGLLPLSDASLGTQRPPEAEFDLLSEALRLRHRCPTTAGWHPGLVPVFYCGCNVFECVDCLARSAPVITLDFGTDADELPSWPSLTVRLEEWLIVNPSS